LVNTSKSGRSTPLLTKDRLSDLFMASLFVGACYAIYFYFGDIDSFQENGLFETGQNVLFFASGIVFFVTAALADDKAHKSVMCGLALFCMSFLAREVDIRGTSLEPYLGGLSPYRIPYIFLLILWVGLLYVVMRSIGATWQAGVKWLLSIAGGWFLAGAVLYILGDLADKHVFTDGTTNYGINRSEMIEEALEFIGTLFVLYASYVSLRRQWRLTTSQQTLSPDDEQ